MFLLLTHCFFVSGKQTHSLSDTHIAPHTQSYILLYTSAPPRLQSFRDKSNPLLCHLIEPLRLLLFYLSTCWSRREVDARLSPALSAKVTELRMKVCRSDECCRLTVNLHQSNCGRGGAEMPDALGGAVASLRILHYLSGLLAVWRHGPAVCSDLLVLWKVAIHM